MQLQLLLIAFILTQNRTLSFLLRFLEKKSSCCHRPVNPSVCLASFLCSSALRKRLQRCLYMQYHIDPSASSCTADWQTAYDDRAGATSHSSVTGVLLGKEKVQILCLTVWASRCMKEWRLCGSGNRSSRSGGENIFRLCRELNPGSLVVQPLT